ncbi:S8 family serine peptidase [Streptomyces albipurpureus]|uniref:S8 family serine peptidase n=1 Tax=Streptomyces albipurpureus TaxID=2897419 RepID=A0ABT0UTK0_9ACTN|nr:S8 family serine peptidase [Streptomyces sp. CWNU-1]MCM2391918.1 S8 family serine peptidase [Streptomyces sp. CWNU-1]
MIANKRNQNVPAVLNASVGGSRRAFLEAAAWRVRDADTLPVISAGKDRTHACDHSPAQARYAFTVAGTDRFDREYDVVETNGSRRGTNNGPCVKIYAPGEASYSALPRQQEGTMPGTSMATPQSPGW